MSDHLPRPARSISPPPAPTPPQSPKQQEFAQSPQVCLFDKDRLASQQRRVPTSLHTLRGSCTRSYNFVPSVCFVCHLRVHAV